MSDKKEEKVSEIKEARESVASMMRKRRDTPLRFGYTDGNGAFCATGLCLEAFRIESSGQFAWKGVNLTISRNNAHPVHHVLSPTGEGVSGYIAREEMMEWLGLSIDSFHDIVTYNDTGGKTWENIALYLLSKPISFNKQGVGDVLP